MRNYKAPFHCSSFLAAAYLRASENEGSSVLELALVTPLLLLLLAGAVDFGHAFRLGLAVSSAAEAGALYGLGNPTDTAGMTQAAAAESSLPSLQAAAMSGCECADGSSPVPSCTSAPTCASNVVRYIDVTTTAAYTPLWAIAGLPASYTLRGHARLRAAFPGK